MDEIRIVPPVIEFKDVVAGSTRKIKINVINAGKVSKVVRFTRLQSESEVRRPRISCKQ